jgi:hypothetical protein
MHCMHVRLGLNVHLKFNFAATGAVPNDPPMKAGDDCALQVETRERSTCLTAA